MRLIGDMVTPRSRIRASIVAFVTAVIVLVAGPAVAAPAAPDEGDDKNLRAALESAAKGLVEAKAKYDRAKKRQLELGLELKKLEDRLVELNAEIALVADHSYRVGRLSAVTMLLNSASPDDFIERMIGLETLFRRDNRQLQALIETRNQAARAKAAIDREVKEEKKQVEIMERKKREAERALAAVGGGPAGGFVSANSPAAQPAPRNPDGSWPPESCTVADPTTSGCLTPRTLHALKQAQAAGFTRYVACWRAGSSGEHPKGRACDFAANPNGFVNAAATGGDLTYGNNLAAFFINNATRLGVMYVIWYRQIWMPGIGWRVYNGDGTPAGDHTNHVHLSVL